MRPPRCFIMVRVTALQQLNVPFRFTSITSSNEASSIFAMSPSRVMPALFTSTSMRPNVSSVASTRRAASSMRETSAATAMARTPSCSVIASASSRAASSERGLAQLTQTLQPASASSSAIARPIPRLDPVTMALRAPSGALLVGFVGGKVSAPLFFVAVMAVIRFAFQGIPSDFSHPGRTGAGRPRRFF